ncbi:MAG: HAD family hydrolase [Peptoniphilus harei]|uniref:HAD family hydrolase n=1 Tax=Peptoniphilus harei TaxID=54005 RepID=UPI00254D5365|nr:HAD family hydrolase [Peptoniphilus harei]MDK7755766.1 HAD family hydrolase [Peptoniphilus harei]MDK7761442.1 HAD family hydrolase [Peptoniphilus harei]MDK8271263.1 HAD family hydrolase [Peptoniphilus harei]MDK8339599.1 HAD family hydrolase [Peptoniphilus harei]
MIRAILFDKDGTLFQFTEGWVDSIVGFLEDKILDDNKKREAFREIGIREDGGVEENSILSSETAMDLAIIFSKYLDEDLDEIYGELDDHLLRYLKENNKFIRETCDLRSLFEALRDRGILIGIFTSDNYRQAKYSMDYLGLDSFIDFYAAADIYKKKPNKESLEVFKKKYSLEDQEIIIVGDSRVDMVFGEDTVKVGVLCGTGSREMLAKYTDNIIDDPSQVLKFL